MNDFLFNECSFIIFFLDNFSNLLIVVILLCFSELNKWIDKLSCLILVFDFLFVGFFLILWMKLNLLVFLEIFISIWKWFINILDVRVNVFFVKIVLFVLILIVNLFKLLCVFFIL